MSNLRVYDPFSIEPFEDLFRSWLRPMRADIAAAAAVPQIKLEVRENDKEFVVKAQIPGVKKDDIEVKIDGDMVSINAETREEKEEKKNGKLLRSEIHYGAASRAFSLGTGVDAAKAQAKYDAGVLELVLPKKATAETRKLTIQ
jgi:HSP20 family protein